MSIWLRPERVGSTTLVVPCGNRQAFLRRVLPTWLACDGVDEIVISSYGSSPRLNASEWLNLDPRVVLVETRERTWSLPRCSNLGVRMARGSVVVKVDADIRLRDDFLTKHPLDHASSFWAGNWRHARNDNERHINGTTVFSRAGFEAVGGYSEVLAGYGADDTDFYERLVARGWHRRDLDPDTLTHIEHGDPLRAPVDPLLGIWINRALARAYRWGPERTLPRYSLQQVGERHIVCRRRTSHCRVPGSLRRRAEREGLREYLALKQGREIDQIPACSNRVLWHWARSDPARPVPSKRAAPSA